MILSYFYQTILDRLMADTVDLPSLGIKHFDLWNHQLDESEEDEELPFLYPAAFLEIEPLQWDTLGRRLQSADCTFNIYVGCEVIPETSSRESQPIRDAGLAHLALMDGITQRLFGFNDGDRIGTISRTTDKPDYFHGSIQVHVISFKCRLTDKIAVKPLTVMDPSPNAVVVNPSIT